MWLVLWASCYISPGDTFLCISSPNALALWDVSLWGAQSVGKNNHFSFGWQHLNEGWGLEKTLCRLISLHHTSFLITAKCLTLSLYASVRTCTKTVTITLQKKVHLFTVWMIIFFRRQCGDTRSAAKKHKACISLALYQMSCHRKHKMFQELEKLGFSVRMKLNAVCWLTAEMDWWSWNWVVKAKQMANTS